MQVNFILNNNRSRSDQEAVQVRCLCGSLLARRVPEGVELKCRRCKRKVVIPLQDEDKPSQ